MLNDKGLWVTIMIRIRAYGSPHNEVCQGTRTEGWGRSAPALQRVTSGRDTVWAYGPYTVHVTIVMSKNVALKPAF